MSIVKVVIFFQLLMVMAFGPAWGNEVNELAYKEVYSASEVAARYSTSALSAAVREVKTDLERHEALTKFCFNIGALMEVSRTIKGYSAAGSAIKESLDPKTLKSVGELSDLSSRYLTRYETAANFCERHQILPLTGSSENALGLPPEELARLTETLKTTTKIAFDVKHAVEEMSPTTASANPWAQDKK